MSKTQTDIVERLRWWGDQTSLYPVGADVREAADEIERLRADNTKILLGVADAHGASMSEQPAHKTAKIAQAVAAERAAILEMIEAYADEQLVERGAAEYIAAAIRARGEQQ
jgi:hypothetical protein